MDAPDFERARTTEQFSARRKDIINACNSIYDKEGYDAVNFKRLSEVTAIKRSAIYNYYKSKEEVLIDSLSMELKFWQEDLSVVSENLQCGEKERFCKALTQSLVSRERLLRLYSILFTILEPNCRQEKLVAFKVTALETSGMLCRLLGKILPELSKEALTQKTALIISLVLGLYPMCTLNEKQRKALQEVDIPYEVPDFPSLCETGILRLIER